MKVVRDNAAATAAPERMTPAQFEQYALMGGLMALFQSAETMVHETIKHKAVYKFAGKMGLNVLKHETTRINEFLEKSWGQQDGDTMNFLSRDVVDTVKVLASLDIEVRTNMADSFRRVWGHMQADMGVEHAHEAANDYIDLIREGRGLKFPDHAEDEVAVSLKEEATAQGLPNCVLFVRERGTKAFIEGATVHVSIGEKPLDLIKSTDLDTLYERAYPTGETVQFRAFKTGYIPGGLDKLFYADDPEQLVVTLWLDKAE